MKENPCCLYGAAGWLYGILNGVVGYFPAEMVRPLARHEVDSAQQKALAVGRSNSFKVGLTRLLALYSA